MKDYIIETKDLSKSYSGVTVLRSVDFNLRKGEVHAIVGENGAGKSTMVKLLTGVILPDKGSSISINGKAYSALNPIISKEQGISVIHQDINLFPDLSIVENIVIGNVKDKFYRKKKSESITKEVLKKIGCEDFDIAQTLGELSIGQQQLVYLARSIVNTPKVLIMDEPSSALSEKDIESLYRVIEVLKGKGVSIIYISHKLEEVLHVSDRITVLRDGVLIDTFDASNADIDSIIHMMAGDSQERVSNQVQKRLGNVVMTVKDITIDGLYHEIALELHEKEVLGITGLLGSGMSEVAQTLFGLRRADRGEVFLYDDKVEITSPAKAMELGICYIPEEMREFGLFMKHNIATNISASSISNLADRFGLIDRVKEYEMATESINKLRIKPTDEQINVYKMSGGNQRKVLLSRWLNTNSKIFIVDEPTSGVDVVVKAEIHRILKELANSGSSVIIITSDLNELCCLSDNVIVMNSGRIVQRMAANQTDIEKILRKGMLSQ